MNQTCGSISQNLASGCWQETKPDSRTHSLRLVLEVPDCQSVWVGRHLRCTNKQSGTPQIGGNHKGKKKFNSRNGLEEEKNNGKPITFKPYLGQKCNPPSLFSGVSLKDFKILRTPENFLNYKFINTV